MVVEIVADAGDADGYGLMENDDIVSRLSVRPHRFCSCGILRTRYMISMRTSATNLCAVP